MATIYLHLDANRTKYIVAGWLAGLGGFFAVGLIGIAILDMIQPGVPLF